MGYSTALEHNHHKNQWAIYTTARWRRQVAQKAQAQAQAAAQCVLDDGDSWIYGMKWLSHWIGLRENLQETMVFTIKLIGLSGFNFPIIQFYDYHPSLVQCEAPKISKLVYNSDVTMVYGTQITIVTGANLNQHSHHWGASHSTKIRHYP